MNKRNSRRSLRKMVWVGTWAFATALLCGAACRGQEVSPDHFTATGIDDAHATKQPPKQKVKLAKTKNTAKTTLVARSTMVHATLVGAAGSNQ